MKKSGMPWLGIAGFVAGILCGMIFLRAGMPSGGVESSGFPTASKRDRLERVGKSRDAKEQVFFHNLIASLPPDQQARIRARMAPLLREISELGIGEYAYYDLAILAIAEAAREHPEVTFNYLLEQGDPTQLEHYFSSVLHEWLLKDPAAAETAVAGLPPGDGKDVMEQTLFRETTSIDPDKALDLLKALKNPSGPDYYHAFLSLSKRGVESAIRQLDEIHDESFRGSAAAGIAEIYAKEHPDKAWDWAFTNQGDARLAAVSPVITEMLKENPSAAIHKVEALQSKEIKGLFVGRIVQEIAQHDPQAAYRLMNKNALPGGHRYVALSTIVNLDLEGERLPQIKEMVTNEPAGQNRDQLVAGFVKNWAQTDPAAAYQWLQETGDLKAVPEELREQLARGEKSTGSMESGIRFK
jgi:hypothetical protein